MTRRIMIDEQMLVSATRYALGRATYIVGTTIDSIKAVCSKHGEPLPCPTPQASCVPVDEGDRC